MNDKIRVLLREVCNGDISRAQTAAMILLKSNTVKKKRRRVLQQINKTIRNR